MLVRMPEKDQKKSLSLPYSFLTFNMGCLPGNGLINDDLLEHNKTRVDELIKRLTQWNESPEDDMPSPSVISFQEVFDILEHEYLGETIAPYFTRHHLKEGLKKYYPYHTDHVGDHIRESGLLLFSKFPLIITDDLTGTFYQKFNNIMHGNERLAIKGFIRIKLQVDEQHFITVYTTHLEAGGAFAKTYQSKHHGTVPARRNAQLGDIYQDMAKQRKTVPTGTSLQYLKSFFLGDLNDAYNSIDDAYAISVGDGGFDKGLTMYPERQLLFKEIMQFGVPDNFINVWVPNSAPMTGQTIDEKKVTEAKDKHYFIGTPIIVDKLKANRKDKTPLTAADVQPKVIDVLVASKEGIEGKLCTRILLFNELTGQKNVEPVDKQILSDHHPVYGRFTPVLFKQPDKVEAVLDSVESSKNQCVLM